MTRDVAGDFASAGGVADMDGIAEIEMLDDRGRVGGIMVHVVALRHLARTSVAATVDADHAIAVLEEEQHLGIPVVRTERPAVMEYNWLPLAPVFVEDVRAVFGFDHWH